MRVSDDEEVMKVTAEEYLPLITDEVGFVINVMSYVDETGQRFATKEDFRLRLPDIKIEVRNFVRIFKLPFGQVNE